MKKCVNCQKGLRGRQTKFCCRKCKNIYNNLNYQSYLAQQKRGKDRKLELIKLKGGKCARCGYDKNFSALEFHHPAPNEKEFQLDLRSLSNRKWDVIINEAKECLLLCSNCHAELHHPECRLRA